MSSYTPNHMNYRRDIDGLRAIAIMSVLWFHSGLPGISGGFTGVDIFFVISGFLITLIIIRETQSSSFSIKTFYIRRVRRIIPALSVVTAGTLLLALLFLLPHEIVHLAESAISATFMLSNFYFWQTGNYFRMGERVTPLLHTWSLSVEEQFYIAFPIFIFIALRRNLPIMILFLAFIIPSFAMSVVLTELYPGLAFYMFPIRAWEILIGGLLAFLTLHNYVIEKPRHLISTCGAILIFAGFLLITKHSSFPGWLAALPVVGTAFIIISGQPSVVNSLLSHPILVFVGKLSYSLYLVHWPVFVFMRHFRGDMELPTSWALSGVLISLFVSWIIYKFIETPFRDRRLTSGRLVGIVTIGLSAGIVALSIYTINHEGLAGRFDDQIIELASKRMDYSPVARTCLGRSIDDAMAKCMLGDMKKNWKGSPEYVVWGDSHASAIAEGVAVGVGDRPGLLLAFNSCPPTVEWVNPRLRGRDRASCRKHNDKVMRFIEEENVQLVILVAFWRNYEETLGSRVWIEAQNTIDTLVRQGRDVILIHGVPLPTVDVPWNAAISARWGRDRARVDCSEQPAADLHGALLVDVRPYFCGRLRDDGDALLFVDSNHPSRFAEDSAIAPAVKEALGR